MNTVLHHVYTSFGGYKTVHCCDELAGLKNRLETQAENLISGDPGFIIRRDDQAWWVTVIRKNGFDHVGRPRSLVHTIAVDYSQSKLPVVFSPAFLLVMCLDRLEHDDPGLAYRLPTNLSGLPKQLREQSFDQLVTDREVLRACLRGEAKSLFIASYDALESRDQTVMIRNSATDGTVDKRLATGLIPLWVHQQNCVVSNLAHMVEGNETVAKLHINESVESARITNSGRISTGHVLIDLFKQIEDPLSLFWMLAAVPYTDRFKAQPMRHLFDMIVKFGWPLALRSSQKNLGLKESAACLHFLSALAGIGGLPLVHQLLFDWRSQQTVIDPEVQELLDARLVALNDETTAMKLLQLLQEEKLLC